MINDEELEQELLLQLLTLEETVDIIGPTKLRQALNEKVVSMRLMLVNFKQEA